MCSSKWKYFTVFLLFVSSVAQAAPPIKSTSHHCAKTGYHFDSQGKIDGFTFQDGPSGINIDIVLDGDVADLGVELSSQTNEFPATKRHPHNPDPGLANFFLVSKTSVNIKDGVASVRKTHVIEVMLAVLVEFSNGVPVDYTPSYFLVKRDPDAIYTSYGNLNMGTSCQDATDEEKKNDTLISPAWVSDKKQVVEINLVDQDSIINLADLNNTTLGEKAALQFALGIQKAKVEDLNAQLEAQTTLAEDYALKLLNQKDELDATNESLTLTQEKLIRVTKVMEKYFGLWKDLTADLEWMTPLFRGVLVATEASFRAAKASQLGKVKRSLRKTLKKTKRALKQREQARRK